MSIFSTLARAVPQNGVFGAARGAMTSDALPLKVARRMLLEAGQGGIGGGIGTYSTARLGGIEDEDQLSALALLGALNGAGISAGMGGLTGYVANRSAARRIAEMERMLAQRSRMETPLDSAAPRSLSPDMEF